MKRSCAMALAALFVLVACGEGRPPAESSVVTSTTIPALSSPDPIDPAGELEAARHRWAEQGLESYRYRFADGCGECDPELREPFSVAVYEGRLLPGDERGVEIAELFDRIEDAIGDGDTVVASYDDATGVPQEIMFNPEDFAVDGGTHYKIDDFVAGPPGEPVTGEAIDAALATWNQQGFRAYEYVVDIACDCSQRGAYRIRIAPSGNEITALSGNTEEFDVAAQPIDELLEEIRSFEAAGEIEDLGATVEALIRIDPALGHLTWLWVDVEVEFEDRGLESINMVAEISDVAPVEEPTPQSPDALDEFLAARAIWRSRGYANYQYRLSFNCFCAEEYRGPFEVTVENGVITRATRLGEPVNEDVGLLTVDQIFGAIGGALESGVRIDVRYDRATGVPIRADLDLDAIAVDGGLSLSIDDFQPLPDEAALDELASMRATWTEGGAADYVLSYEVYCECNGGAITIVVRDHDFFETTVRHPDGTEASAPPEFRYTVDTLFDLIGDALSTPAFAVDVAYDKRLGVPQQITIDWDGDTVDDEILIANIVVEPGR